MVLRPCMFVLALMAAHLMVHGLCLEMTAVAPGFTAKVVITPQAGDKGGQEAIKRLRLQVSNPAQRSPALKEFLVRYGVDPNAALPPLQEGPVSTTGAVAAATTNAMVAAVAPTMVGPVSNMGVHPDSYLADAHGKTIEDTYVAEEEIGGISAKKPIKVHPGLVCGAPDVDLQPKLSWHLCASAAATAGADFFAVGTGSGACHIEKTSGENCPEGLTPGASDFYKLQPIKVKVVPHQSGVACANSTELGNVDKSSECASRVASAGGVALLFGKGNSAGRCFSMATVTCPVATGAPPGDYDLYEVEELPA